MSSATEADGNGALRGGFFSSLFGRNNSGNGRPALPPMSTAALAAEPSLGASIAANGHASAGNVGSAPGSEFSFCVARQAAAATPDTSGARSCMPGSGGGRSAAPLANAPKRRGLLSFLGC